MRLDFWEAAESLPSVRRFLGRVSEDLGAGRSVLALLPPGVPAALLRERLRERLGRNLLWASLAADHSSLACADPGQIARIFLRPDTPARLGLAELARLPDCPEVIAITGLDKCVPAVRRQGLQAFTRWAREVARPVRAETTRPPSSLCAIERATLLIPDLPASAPTLALHYWWGFPSALELRGLCRELAVGARAREEWRECLISGLAPGDLGAACALWEADPADVDEAGEALRTYGRTLGLQAEVPNGLASLRGGLGRPEPPAHLRQAWAAGLVVASHEYGIEASPAAVAFCEDREELRRRLWRGQAPVLLPLADAVRLGACTHLTRMRGARWYQTVGALPADPEHLARLEENPLGAEFGYLVIALRALGPGLEHGRWRERAEVAREVRNRLSHYEPVPFARFAEFVALADGCRASALAH